LKFSEAHGNATFKINILKILRTINPIKLPTNYIPEKFFKTLPNELSFKYQGLIRTTKILGSEIFSVKSSKFCIHQFFGKWQKIFLWDVLALLANEKSENVLQNWYIWTQSEISVTIFRNLKICTQFIKIFCFFLVGWIEPRVECYQQQFSDLRNF
jgi:hypothetical protein